MCYLDMAGYKVIELERITRGRRNFAELIGFGILSSNQAAELLGYASTSRLYKLLQRHSGGNKEKDQKMWDIWKEKREALEQKKAESRELYGFSDSLKVRSKAGECEPTADVHGKAFTSLQTVAVKMMEGLLVLFENGFPDNPSESDFREFQHSADTVLRLSARLSALSSQLIMHQKPEGGGT